MKSPINVMALAIMLFTTLPVMASPITFSASSGSQAASVTFDQSGGNLIVTLSNTSTYDALVPTDILGAVFFDISGNPLLTRSSAIVPLSSSVREIGTGADVTPVGGVVGGEWAYLNSLSLGSNNEGISSVGLGVFGPSDLFPGTDLVPPPSPDGINLGITTAGDNLLTGNGGIAGQWLIYNTVVFTLGGYHGDPSADIHSVTFQYGTALTETSITIPEITVPEPSTLVLAGLGVVGLLAARWRRV